MKSFARAGVTTLVRLAPNLVYDQMIGMGCARKFFSWVGIPAWGRRANVLIWGLIGIQKEAVLAARRSLVTVEEIVDRLDAGQTHTSSPRGSLPRSPSCRVGARQSRRNWFNFAALLVSRGQCEPAPAWR